MAEQTQLISSWTRSFEGMRQSTQEFYAVVERTVQGKQIPDVKFSRVEFKEGGLFSGKREYLQVQRGDLVTYVCGAPFGNGFFVSMRLFAKGSLIDAALGKAELVKAFVKPDTFYKVDTTQMYLALVHSALMEVIDSLTSSQNLPKLGESDRRPIMMELYQ